MSNEFQITAWDETAYIENEDGSKKSHAKITQTYSGAIEGSSELQYLMSYQTTAVAVFVGFEVVTATLEQADIAVEGLFLNADAGFDSKNFREFCSNSALTGN